MVLLSCLLFGESQTFVGALLTLIVLCLFYTSKKRGEEKKDDEEHNSNFIRNLLLHFNDDITSGLSGKIKGLANRHLSTMPDLYNFNFKLYNDILNEVGRHKELENCRESLLSLYNGLSSLPHILVAEMSEWEVKVHKCLNNLQNIREYELISYYTFLYALLFMFVDGFFLPGTTTQYLATFLYSFIISSCGYCFVIWQHFWIQSSCTYIKEYAPTKIVTSSRYKKLWIFFVYYVGMLLWRILCLVFIPVLSILVGSMFEKPIWGLMVSCMITTISFLLGGKRLFDMIKFKNNYNRLFIFSHFLYILGASFLAAYILDKSTFIYTILDSMNILEYPTSQYHFTDLGIAGEIAIIFILLNSIILPLFLPYFRVQYYMVGFNFNLTCKYIKGIYQFENWYKEYKKITSIIDAEYGMRRIKEAKVEGANDEKYRIATLLIQKQADCQLIKDVTGITCEQIKELEHIAKIEQSDSIPSILPKD